MPVAEYTVRLDAFEGPLDLLLFLIRRAEVEVTDIPIAQVTEQYLKYIGQLTSDPAATGRIDIERAGEFLVMAATLMEIKSRMLTPPAASTAASTDSESDPDATSAKAPADPRAELIKQLLEYKRFRDASMALDQSKRRWEDMFPAGRALAPRAEQAADALAAIDPDIAVKVDLDDIELIDLVEAFARVIETVDLSRVGEHRVVMDDTPVELHAEDIVDRLSRLRTDALASGLDPGTAAGEMEFVKVFDGRSRSEAIGLFLAILELVKQQRVLVRQEDDDRSGRKILLRLSDHAPAPADASAISAADVSTH
ncbi:MAG: segregation/condensation protein A [Phycisphaerales bacterium]|nr:segregation/condensation protein A [Phycisphaerales bacterium]